MEIKMESNTLSLPDKAVVEPLFAKQSKLFALVSGIKMLNRVMERYKVLAIAKRQSKMLLHNLVLLDIELFRCRDLTDNTY
jgi:hypothetical protein